MVKSPQRRKDKKPDSARRLPPDARRFQIIEAAERLFCTRPYTELGVGDVARAAGITQGLVYHYFPSKEAVFAAACELRARELLRSCLPDEDLPLPEQVQRGVRGYFDFVLAHSIEYQNLLRGPTAAEQEIQTICEATRQVIIDRFVAAVGFADSDCTALRLSLRGYLGYCESAILAWLPNKSVPRAALEHMLCAMIQNSLLVGLANEQPPLVSPEALEVLAQAFRDHSVPAEEEGSTLPPADVC